MCSFGHFSKLETTCENPAIGEDLCSRIKITCTINKCDMNLNFTFHVLIHVHVSALEAFYLAAYISVVMCCRLYILLKPFKTVLTYAIFVTEK